MSNADKKTNPWIIHVKKYALEHNKAYGCAISDPMCKETYKKNQIKRQKVIKK